MDALEIIKALDGPLKEYPDDAVQAAVDQKDDVVPLLLEHLEQVLLDPEKYADPEYDSFLHMYAVCLLGHHRVREAHKVLIRLLSLPGELSDEIFGDLVNDGFPAALWKTCGGDTSDIKKLIQNRDADEYCRSSGVTALTYGVAEKVLERDDVVKYLQGLFTGEESTPDRPLVWNTAALALTELWPGDSMDVLNKAYDDDLIELFYISMNDIEAYLEEGREARLASFEKKALEKLSEPIHEQMEWWADFESPVFDSSFNDDTPVINPGKARDRKKQKQARKARRKARRKGRKKKKKKR